MKRLMSLTLVILIIMSLCVNDKIKETKNARKKDTTF